MLMNLARYLWLSLVLWVGCGPGGPEMAPVSGTVMLDGQPLTSGQVVFVPTQGPSAFGAIQEDGSFTLNTKRPGDGALVGNHRVSVTPIAVGRSLESMQQGGTERSARTKPVIPARYHSADTSELTQQVVKGENRIEIRLSSR